MSSNTSPSKSKAGPRRHLATTLFLAFLAVALVPAIVVTTASAINQVREARAQAIADLGNVAEMRQERALAWVEASKAALLLAAQDPTNYQDAVFLLTYPRDAEGQQYQNTATAFLDRVSPFRSGISTAATFKRITLADADGLVRVSSDSDQVGDRLGEAEYFEQASSVLEDVYVSFPTPDEYGVLSVYYAKPITDSDGRLLGLLIGQGAVSSLDDIMNDQVGLGETGETFLVSPDKRFITSSRYHQAMTEGDSTAIEAVISGRNGSGVWTDYNGQTAIGVYRWIPQLGVGLIAKQSRAEALSAVYARIWTDMLIGALVVTGALAASVLLARRITAPIVKLTHTTRRITDGELDLRVEVQREDEIGQLASAFNETADRVQALVDSLEDRVRERTRDLQVTAEIGHEISAMRDIDQVLSNAVELICERLGYYHAQVFLVDDVVQCAVLRASTGEAGRELLRRGHKLAIGSHSVIGQVTARGEPVAARDTDTSPVHRRNELLPNTRAELAIPIRLAGEVIGALDVQSVEPEAFDPQTIAVLQTIADQLAVAINNARLFEETQSLLSASMLTARLLTREGWQEFAEEQLETVGFAYDLSDVFPLDQPVASGGDGGLDAPITLRGQIIGQLMAHPPEGREWTEEDRALVESIAERLALALENARLFSRAQATLQSTIRLYETSRAISEAVTVEELLDVALEAVTGDEIDRTTIALLDDPDVQPDERWIEMRAVCKRLEDDPLEPGNRLSASNIPFLADAERSSQPVVIDDLRRTTELDAQSRNVFLAFGIKAVAIIPLEYGGRVLGWMMIQTLRQPRPFSQSEVRFYRVVADQTATALEGLMFLERSRTRARRLMAANDVSHTAATILDTDILLPQIVERISEAFGYYHAQVFLIDEMGEDAVLRASTGEVGRKLLARHHKLPIGSQSVIGQVTKRGEPIIARDTDVDPIHRRNELLPDTRSELAIPLKIGTRVIGALDVQSEKPNAFDQEAVAILQTLASQIAVSLENAQLFREIGERVAELATINLASQSLARARTLDEVGYYLAEQLTQTFNAHYAHLALWNRAGNLLSFPVFIQAGRSVEPPPPVIPDGSLTGHVLSTGQPLLLNQVVAEDVKTFGEQVVGTPVKSWLGVPLTLGDEVLGVLSLQDVEEDAFDASQQRTLSTLAAYIAVAVRSAQLFEETQQHARDLGFLFDVTAAAVSTSDLELALQRIAETLHLETLAASAVVISLLDPAGEKLVPRAVVGHGPEASEEQAISIGEGIPGWVAEHGQPALVPDVAEDIRYAPIYEDTRSEMALPLTFGKQVIGVLDVHSAQPGAFSEDDLRLFETMAGTASAVIQNARLLAEIRTANEQLRELDKLKSQFLANMSHELRTPLNSIIGFSRVILKGIDGPLTGLQQQDLETIHSSGQHLLSLINDILDQAKIEAGKMKIQPDYLDMRGIIGEVMATAGGLVKGEPIELITDVPDDLPPVYGDQMRIRQVLLNLISNAAKFTNEGSITLRALQLPAEPATGKPARVRVDVIDTGIGIAPEDQAKLFEAFSQVDTSTTRQTGGTGLGLAISRQMIELHGGRMWIESELGKGSIFSFTLPLHPSAEHEEPALRPTTTDRPIVLAVDDDQGVLELYQRYLDKQGYTIIGLTSGRNAVEYVRQYRPVAVVLDIMMPEQNGWQVIAELKSNPDTRRVPVIMCTIVEEQNKGFSLGAANYLTKPILEDDLIEALARLDQDGIRDVLVVGDELEYLYRIRNTLELTGAYQVRRAVSGAEALDAIQQRPPDLLILDMVMPDLDGLDILAQVRNDERTRDMPVLLLAADTLSDEERQHLADQAVQLINKTAYSGDELLVSIAQTLASLA